MTYRLRADVLDEAIEITGAKSDDQLGQAFLDRTGQTVRNWRFGKTAPDLASVAKLQRITGRAFEDMVDIAETSAA
ncbi:hypothetical protein I6I10_06840 [Corynebacterium glucuronolyticum]|uniref:Uncharacterized protein n=1 Tax=Corynebacterium glucuronolyticum TaxID=39791 RepID=A0A7T4BN82_9CORY|nr:hypothetical protein [Corynebacterium glucuronolyticum]QQB45327.1 hypothetical protein I6I10_07215 [Corynebacterium glucuronolyticum]QQB47578.1 hypothetical protein I6I10_06840 [Corynebacterium glucuronolyticum]WKD64061.1 hypothetical protein CGLUCO_09080 [Corynebacterium glucuronolyticum DSM 44120]SMB82274.1 hypothetical protein SAMN05660745_02602 [Corynebacterium glucuronolyticum]